MKAIGTAVSGYMAKELLAAYQSEVLGPKDSDCGSKGFITINITNKNYPDYLYRYILTSKGLVMTTMENKDLFVNKTVKMRSPMFCIGTGPTKCLCNKCAGDFFYILGKPNIGLTASKLATTITQMNLQKFHQNLVKTQQLDVDDMLI